MLRILKLLDSAADLWFRIFRHAPPFSVLAILSVLTAVVALLAVRWTSNQAAIRRAKDRIGAHLLAVRLFPDQLRVVLRAYLALFGNTLLYLKLSLRPVLFLALPLLLLFVQMEAYFELKPVPVGDDFLVRVTLRDAALLSAAQLALPQDVLQQAPPLRIAADNEVDWKLRAVDAGLHAITLRIEGNSLTKQVAAGKGFERINAARERGGFWARLMHPGEEALPAAGVVERIEINYPERNLSLAGWETGWVWPYLVMTLLAALLLKGVLRTEI